MKRCAKCKRLRFLSRGWKEDSSGYYCPSCWDQHREDLRRIKFREDQRMLSSSPAAALEALCNELDQLGSARTVDDSTLRAVLAALITRAKRDIAEVTKHLQTSELMHLERFRGKDPGVAMELLLDRDRKVVQSARALSAALRAPPDVGRLTTLLLQLSAIEEISFPFWRSSEAPFPLHVLHKLAGVDRGAVLSELTRALTRTDREHWGAQIAVVALGQVSGIAASDVIRDVLNREFGANEGSLRFDAACALIAMGDHRAIPHLLEEIAQGTTGIDMTRWITEAIAPLVRTNDLAYAEVSARWLREKELFDPDEEDSRLTEAGWSKLSPLYRTLAAALLHSGRPVAIEIASTLGASRDRRRALQGARVLADLRQAEATLALASILANQRKYAVGYSNSSDIVGSVASEYEWNDEQRLLAATSLASRGSIVADEALRKALDDSRPQVVEHVRTLLQHPRIERAP